MTVRLLLLACALAVSAAGAPAREDGFQPLFNGRDLDGLTLVGMGPDTLRVENGVIRCSGKPGGYFATRRSYRNYVLKFDWRYPRPAGLREDAAFQGNSGVLLHITGEHRVWPQSIEVQLMNRDAGNIFGLLGGKAAVRKDNAAQERAIRPVGEWNRQEVISRDGRVTVRINGEIVAEATACRPSEGPIGWQSEGTEIHFRGLEIRELK